jgi:hypothetical protein
MKVVKWGVHGTGTCIGPGILLIDGAELAHHAKVNVRSANGFWGITTAPPQHVAKD